ARRLSDYLRQKTDAAGADQVDIVAHSMGGLIARRYIARYMAAGAPNIHQLIMLGTPNMGSITAEVVVRGLASLGVGGAILAAVGFRYPATLELMPSYLLGFNIINNDEHNVPFYAVAGNYLCMNSSGFPKEIPGFNPIEPDPDDVIVWRNSVFAIPLKGRWTFPGQQTAGCEGDH